MEIQIEYAIFLVCTIKQLIRGEILFYVFYQKKKKDLVRKFKADSVQYYFKMSITGILNMY